jgi:phosphoribosyl 1,2-cyclic phosphodiesterase
MNIRVLASGSGGNAYVVSDGKTTLLLDAGIPLKAIQAGCGFGLHSLSGCLLTHEHGDHCKAVKDLIKRGVDVYASAGTFAACQLSGHRAHAVKPLRQLKVDSFAILPFDVQHDAAEPLGFLIESTVTGEKLLYATDTYYIKYRFIGLTHIMIECNYDAESVYDSIDAGETPVEMFPRLVKSHMSLENLMDMLKANDRNRLRQIYLLHMSGTRSDADRCKQEIQKLTGAEVYIA